MDTNSMIGSSFGDSIPDWSIFIEAKKKLINQSLMQSKYNIYIIFQGQLML